jgi:hypothetical protein
MHGICFGIEAFQKIEFASIDGLATFFRSRSFAASASSLAVTLFIICTLAISA